MVVFITFMNGVVRKTTLLEGTRKQTLLQQQHPHISSLFLRMKIANFMSNIHILLWRVSQIEVHVFGCCYNMHTLHSSVRTSKHMYVCTLKKLVWEILIMLTHRFMIYMYKTLPGLCSEIITWDVDTLNFPLAQIIHSSAFLHDIPYSYSYRMLTHSSVDSLCGK